MVQPPEQLMGHSVPLRFSYLSTLSTICALCCVKPLCDQSVLLGSTAFCYTHVCIRSQPMFLCMYTDIISLSYLCHLFCSHVHMMATQFFACLLLMHISHTYVTSYAIRAHVVYYGLVTSLVDLGCRTPRRPRG